MGQFARNALFALLVLSAVAPYVGLDAWRIGILFAYTPRIVLAVVAFAVAAFSLRGRRGRRSAGSAGPAFFANPALIISTICTVLFLDSLGWGGGTSATARAAGTRATTRATTQTVAPATTKRTELGLLALNIHQKSELTKTLPAIVAAENIDVLCFQELRLNNRARYVAAFPDFAFYWVEPEQMPQRKGTGVFALATAIRRSRLSDEAGVEVAFGITDYRTFAVRAEIDGSEMWIVNVHATKPIWTEDGMLKMTVHVASSANWHKEESAMLGAWLRQHTDTPVVAAGDFNAPYYADNVTTLGLRNAHLEAGHGPHLSFPAVLPVLGIDHILGNRHIAFANYRLLAAAPSDHRAQIARFTLER